MSAATRWGFRGAAALVYLFLYLPLFLIWLSLLGVLAGSRSRPKARVLVPLLMTFLAALDAVRHIPLLVLTAAPVIAAAPPAAAPAPAPAAVQAANSPLGLWLTEEKEGKVRIEQCGANLCGYSVDKKSNQNGEQVLINMKPAKDAKWSGRILDPNTGSTYDSTIALKGSDSLRVQGCAFGGVFCGGQTWTRVN